MPTGSGLGRLYTPQMVLGVASTWSAAHAHACSRRSSCCATIVRPEGLYTPQMVLGGRIDVVGSARARVREGIELLRDHHEAGPALSVAGDRLSVSAGGQDAAAIWLIAFDRRHDVAIERGENRGRTLRYRHVVRELTRLGYRRGRARELGLPVARRLASGRAGAAILLQRLSDRVILAAVHLRLPPG